MKEITAGLYTYFTKVPHNALYNQINGRFYKSVAVQDAVFPYVVYNIISDVPEYNFTESFEDIRLQFDLLSKSTSSAEIEDMYSNLKSVFDWCNFTITGNTIVHMRRDLARLTNETDYGIFVYNVDYKLYTRLN
jgi:hypothetical protein